MSTTKIFPEIPMKIKNNKSEVHYKDYKAVCIRAAKELHYPKTVLNNLENASSEIELSEIMSVARQKYL